MRTFIVFCLALSACCFLVAQTNPQLTPTAAESPALSGSATNGQTEIRSENGGKFYYKLKTYIYMGNVRVNNPQMKLRCELLTVKSPEMKEGKFNSAVAETNVVIDWVDENGTNHATADKAVYTFVITNLATLPEQRWQTNATVVLSGNPSVITGRGSFNCDPILWDRINDVILCSKLVGTTIYPSTNTPGMFDTSMPKDKPPRK